ncbi:MAG: EFR1 family ferrodoxin [Paludibacteraceae bacterium]|nr:EFR1 family ferrodoxin [Paludibacteraceae bacterium]
MILYFSGSGNSHAIARQLAEKLDERTMSLYDALDADLLDEKRIGLVYPTYWLDAPMAVKQLVAQLTLPKKAYTFIVITCGALTNNAIWSVRKLLKQKDIQVSYSHKIRVPDSSALAFGRNPNAQAWKFNKYASRIDLIASEILNEKQRLHFSGFDPFGWLLNTSAVSRKVYRFTLPVVNPDKCVGCQICTKVCPQANIHLSTGKACIGDRCTMCLSCVHFCPHQAVEVAGKTTLAERQYHHPSIEMHDLIRR